MNEKEVEIQLSKLKSQYLSERTNVNVVLSIHCCINGFQMIENTLISLAFYVKPMTRQDTTLEKTLIVSTLLVQCILNI